MQQPERSSEMSAWIRGQADETDVGEAEPTEAEIANSADGGQHGSTSILDREPDVNTEIRRAFYRGKRLSE